MNSTIKASFATIEERWSAVVEREKSADGTFVYAVKTTGVYCRPSCASRRPNQGNVSFHANCADAERAGFRACKKCKPKAVLSQVPPVVVQVCRLIDAADETPALNDLATAVGLSPYHLHRLFKAAVGVTPKGYAKARRVQRLKEELAQEGTVTKAIYGAGFTSSSRCYEDAEATLGMTPAKYKNGARGVRIRSAIVECYLGWMLVAGTDKGVCVIQFEDQPEDFNGRLAARFPKAEFVDGDEEFATWVAQVLLLMEGPCGLELPLDIQCTAFQQRVWTALQAIPFGSVATYAEVAKRIGRPTAVRAVARACATNPVSIIIPCHRVIGSDGKLTGYAWGVQRKKQLLDHEAATK